MATLKNLIVLHVALVSIVLNQVYLMSLEIVIQDTTVATILKLQPLAMDRLGTSVLQVSTVLEAVKLRHHVGLVLINLTQFKLLVWIVHKVTFVMLTW
jgi:hypothetical protein